MMSRLFRPENAQKRAKEFLDVGKPSRALDVLYEVIRRGKMRNNCSEKVLEPIMFMYLRLCVELKKSHLAKEGLYQYRNIFQSVNVSTLETVVRFYLQLAEERTHAARMESQEAVTSVGVGDRVDDLENMTTPEEMLLSAVSGEDAQDRSDRTILTPWVKFLWESYRQCLELLRNNSRVEKLYHEIAKKAFNFCERYERKTEFRKLCDNLLNHLQHLQKAPTSATAVSLSNPETQQMNLETRLEQLNYAIKMELWQEAYRAIEYVADLMTKSKKSTKPQIMASYYQKLGLVFWKSRKELFHAAALNKHFQLNKEQKKNITNEEVSKRAGVVLVAAMAIPLPSAHPEFDRFIETEKSAMEKISKLATLLNLSKPPTRVNLFKELIRSGVLAAVSPELQQLYYLLEVSFDPLKLCPSMQQQLSWVNEQPELQQYAEAIKEMTVTRLIKQLAQIYSTVTFEWLLKVAVFMEPFKLERILVDLVRHNDLQIRIDHRNGCIHFGTDLSDSQREDLPEGPTLQPMPSETVRCQLVHMYSALNKCLQLIVPDARKKEMEAVRTSCMQSYNQTKNKDHHKILQRQFTIEARKEKLENQTLEREESIRRAQEQQQQKQKEEEQERLKREATEREKQRQEEQMKQIHTKQIKDKLLQISQTSYGQKMIEKFNEEELLNLDAEEILQRQVEELEKERKELQQRLKAQEKKIDYMERAKRLIEIPKSNEYHDTQKEQDKEFWKTEEEKRVKKLVEEHRQALEMCKRFNHMKGDLSTFLDGLKAARRSETEKKMSDFKARLDVERKKRLQERKDQRRRDRREKYFKEKQEEEQKRIDEELKKERETKEAEELEKQRIEEEEYVRKTEELDRQARLRKEKELEIEQKLKQKESGPIRQEPAQPWRGGSKEIRERDVRGGRDDRGGEGREEGIWRPGAGAWREKEQEKLDVWRKKDKNAPPPDTREIPPPPSRRDAGTKDIRLDEDFKNEQRAREEERSVSAAGPPARAIPPPNGVADDSSQRPLKKDEDRFGGRREEGKFPTNIESDRNNRVEDKLPSRGGFGGAGDRDRRWGEDDHRGGGGFRRGGDRDESDYRRGGDRDGGDYRRGGDGGGDQWRGSRGGDFERRVAAPPARATGGGGGGDDDSSRSWRSKPADSRAIPMRRDDGDRRVGGGGGGVDAWRRGGSSGGGGNDRNGGDVPKGRGDGARSTGDGPRGGGRDLAPPREKPAPAQTDPEGWTKVRK